MKKLSFFILIILFACSPESAEPEPLASHVLTISVNPGSGGSVTPDSGGSYDEGTVVSLIGTPSPEYLFKRWSGLNLNSTENPYSLTMDSNKSITAYFEKKQYPLTVNIDGLGAVSEEIVQQGRTDYNSGTIVRVLANPSDGWRFVEWSGDLTGNENPLEILIDAPKNITAHFEEIPSQTYAFDFENAKSLVIGVPNEHGNVKMVIEDDSRSSNSLEMVDLSIPNAFDFTLNIHKTFQLIDSFIILFGELQVYYDLNGDGQYNSEDDQFGTAYQSFLNPIVNTETGEFYDYGSAIFNLGGDVNGPFYIPQASSFGNLTINLDGDDNYYTGLSSVGSYYEMLKIGFEFIPNTDEDGGPNQLELSQETLNLIGGGLYYIKNNGDIVTREGTMNGNSHEYFYRTSSGTTINFTDLVNQCQDDPDIYQGSDDVPQGDQFWRSFILPTSSGELLYFHVARIEQPGQDPTFYRVYSIDFDGSSVSLNRINDTDYNTRINYDFGGGNSYLFEGFDQGPTLHRRGSKNIIINPNQGDFGTVIWYFDDQSQTIEQNFITEITESEYLSSLRIEGEDYMHLALEQNIMRINFQTMQYESVLQDSGYQIYSFTNLSDGVYQFYGISYSTGLKTLCEYDNGNLTVIEEFDNDTDVFFMLQIGNFN